MWKESVPWGELGMKDGSKQQQRECIMAYMKQNACGQYRDGDGKMDPAADVDMGFGGVRVRFAG